jgi:uncharacterized membrane protein
LTLRGRERRGLRGFAGKPFHPPLTDLPIGAYLFVAVFDVVSYVGRDRTWAHDFYRGATFVLIGGAAVSLLTAFTGYLDWRTTEKGSQVRRTANAHAWTMLAVTALVITNIALRWFTGWDTKYTPPVLVAMSVVGALLVSLGSTLGGSLVYDYGFNVENSTDDPVWHPSDVDRSPGYRKSA